MAKQSVLDVIINMIKKGGGDKETIKGLVEVKGAITGAVSVFAALAGAAYAADKILDATAGVYVRYVQNVRDAKLALGLSADETSRVIALTDDLGISYEDLSATIKKNTDNTNFSIEGLAASSSAYLALGNAQEKAAFAQKNYGKQWVEFAKLLEKGPEQVWAMAAAVDEGHLFDEQDLKRVEDYRIAQDQLKDTWEATAMSIGEVLVPALTSVMTAHLDEVRAQELAIEAGKNLAFMSQESRNVFLEQAAAEREAASATDEHAGAMDGAAESAEALSKKYGDQLSMIEKLAKASAKQIKEIAYNNLLAKLSVDGLTEAEKRLVQDAGKGLGIFSQANINTAATMEELAQKVADGELSVAAYNAEVARIERNVQIVFTASQVGLTVAGIGQGFCFIAGTMISMADGSLKVIEDVKIGDEVVSYDTETEKLITAKVKETYHHTDDARSDYFLLINGRIGVTPNHPLYINNQWADAISLQLQDKLKNKDGDELVMSLQWIDRRVPTYNLNIDHESHNYFADGILAHNKAGGGLAHGPGNGSSDTFFAPLANGEFVVNAQAVREPGMLELLQAINSGSPGKGAGGSSVTIYGGVQIVANRNVNDILAELGT